MDKTYDLEKNDAIGTHEAIQINEVTDGTAMKLQLPNTQMVQKSEKSHDELQPSTETKEGKEIQMNIPDESMASKLVDTFSTQDDRVYV